MAINWALGQMPDVGGNAMAAFREGQERKKHDMGQNALAGYAADPSEQNLNALFPYMEPQQVFSVVQGRQKAQADQHEMAQKQRGEMAKYVANAAFDIIQRPEQERAAAWDAYIEQGAQQYPGLTQYRGQYTPQALQALVAEAGKSQEFAQFQRPTYTPIGEQGLAGFQYGQPIQQGGQPQNFAQAVQPPQPGTVEDGYRFRGGNPADPNAWEPLAQGGPQPHAAGTFRP